MNRALRCPARKPRPGGLLTAALAAVLAVATPAVTPAPAPPSDAAPAAPGLFILGIDGVDPLILQRLMDAGEMQHFKALAAEGSLQELGTSNPPQSPVAWSNFVTGMDPGGHGIFDFIHRDPRTYSPIASATAPTSGEEPWVLPIFGLALPVTGGDPIVNNRSGTPFWDLLHAAGVDVEIYRMPGTFPPSPSEARTLSGMGTDDLRALNGKYAWYSDEIRGGTSSLKAEWMTVSREDEDSDGFPEVIRTWLKGPQDALRLHPETPEGGPGPVPDLELPMSVHFSPVDDLAWIRVGGGQCVVRLGGWSEWVEVTFDAMPLGMAPLTGMVRFYLKQIAPDVQLYASPVNFAPGAPATPIGTPDDFSAEIKDAIGNFYTQGMPEEVNALKDGLFEIKDYLSQVEQVHLSGRAMLDLALQRFDPGDMTFMYLSDIDLQCHMLWHVEDPKHPGAPRHPAWTERDAEQGAGALAGFYRGIDAVLGQVRERLPADTTLIVMSDHGFQPYRRKVHLNTWLREQGWLVLKDEHRAGSLIDGRIDWTATKAYGVGFNGIYLNRAGREAQGIVTDAEAPLLVAEITAALEALRDPDGGAQVVKRAYAAADEYRGARLPEAPDVIVGFAAPYGCSEQSTLGEVVDGPAIYDNLGHDFTGNHLMDPSEVPGVLLMNRKLGAAGHDLADVTATVLAHFGVAAAPGMIGTSFLPARD